jgi:LemA protein
MRYAERSRRPRRFSFTAPLSLVAAATLATGCGYNTIQSMDEQVNQAQGQIETQLQRRADLIPNLVNTVRGVAKQETTVYSSIANARARLSGAVQSGDVGQMSQANAELSQGLGRLLAIVENYPELRSSESFQQLQAQLEGTENRIAVARQDYNTAVGDFNSYIRRFPNNMTAKVFGMDKPRAYFEAEGEARQDTRLLYYLTASARSKGYH